MQVTVLTEATLLPGWQARVYDDKVREFVEGVGLENIGKRLVNNREKVEFVKPEMSMEKLLKYGQFLVDEQVRHGLTLPFATLQRMRGPTRIPPKRNALQSTAFAVPRAACSAQRSSTGLKVVLVSAASGGRKRARACQSMIWRPSACLACAAAVGPAASAASVGSCA